MSDIKLFRMSGGSLAKTFLCEINSNAYGCHDFHLQKKGS